ncbi:TraB/GumN family protein [Aurantiacibacter aquimixticola]|uniref:TraB/GumN family protein n=1 Tax=Aurantiacibacter aquimixticola TaxID=1958945 RepID=A0A419RRU3_9SPHN|nr:TraB/GumN family protein [Aurantiacibacter aquimixticola]RJY08508.1 TraB/GumN family protein [Aurantiacibacter aquimixticola]
MVHRFLASALGALAAFMAAAPLGAQDAPIDYSFTQDYEPSPAMWILSDEDTTIYMLGTFHALPRGFKWRSERIEAIIEEADTLVLESSDYDQQLSMIDMDRKLQARIAARTPTSNRLSSAARLRWERLVGMTELDFATVDEMPVLLALLAIGVTGDGSQAGGESLGAYGVETVLEREFRARDKPILSIEDSGEVMYSLFRQDGPAIVAELDSKLTEWDGQSLYAFYDEGFVRETGDDYWREEHNWAQGIVADDFDMGFGDGRIGRAFDTNLLDRRNAAWAEWVQTRLGEPGTVLLAVGAGHFEGDASLLTMLAQRGLIARRLD